MKTLEAPRGLHPHPLPYLRSKPLKRIGSLLVLTLFLLGCKQETKQQEPELPTVETTVDVHKETEAGWIDQIELDQGAKWAANVETTLGVSQMQSAMETSKTEEVSDLHKLGGALNEIKNMIVKECTMTGPSHDNLHVWLYPLISKIEQLQKVESVESGQQMLAEIGEHLDKYYEYFE